MGIPIAGSFTLGSPTPIDDRVVVDNFSDLNSISNRYEGLIAYVRGLQTLFVYKGVNIWQPVAQQSDVESSPKEIIKVKDSPIGSFIPGVKQEGFLPTGISTGQTVYLYNQNLQAMTRIVNVTAYEFTNSTGVTDTLSNINLTGTYQGYALKRLKFNSTIGNGYKEFVLNPQADLNNPPICKPLTRQLETFYDIYVPSGGVGGTRYIKFFEPNAPHFVQSHVFNLKFNFQADNNPCVVNCFFGTNQTFYTLTGANYNFYQKERVILKYGDKNGNNDALIFKVW